MTSCYAAWNKDKDVLASSTSGGVFSALSTAVFKQGGIVVGAAYGEGLCVKHRVAHSEDELIPLRGVKYVYSHIGKAVFEEIDKALESGRLVLFVGVPCQAAAIRKRFKNNDRLLLCDLVCFGCPSQEFWLKYVLWLEQCNKKHLRYICPRDKIYGWGRRTYYRYDWSDGTSTRKCSRYDPYARSFYTTLAFRSACFKCPFRGVDRVSDITLCDMWNADSLGLDKKTLNAGVSGVMVHNDHGKNFFLNLNVTRLEVEVNVFLEGNAPIVNSPDKPIIWEEFKDDAQRLSFPELVKKYRLQLTRAEYDRIRIMRLVEHGLSAILPRVVKNAVKRVIDRG